MAKNTLIQVLLLACCCGTVSDNDNGTLQVRMMQVEEGSILQMAIYALPTIVIDCPYLKEQRLEIFENTFFKVVKVLTAPCRT